jgi:NADH-quinone oxidoreductase subunit J
MPQPLFYLFVAVMLGFGAAVVLLRNPVSSALSLVVSFAGLAALYVSLNAYFAGVLQVLVYAGAVMVLFLFIIMLMDIREEQRRKINKVAVVGGAALVVGFVVQLGGVLAGYEAGRKPLDRVPLQLAEAAEAPMDLGDISDEQAKDKEKLSPGEVARKQQADGKKRQYARAAVMATPARRQSRSGSAAPWPDRPRHASERAPREPASGRPARRRPPR